MIINRGKGRNMANEGRRAVHHQWGITQSSSGISVDHYQAVSMPEGVSEEEKETSAWAGRWHERWSGTLHERDTIHLASRERYYPHS